MGKPRLSRIDYLALGKQRHLTLVSLVTPTDREEKVEWRCNLCQKISRRSFRGVKESQYSCTCQEPRLHNPQQYRDAGLAVGLELVAAQLPASVAHKTRWRTAAGTEIELSYNQVKNLTPAKLLVLLNRSRHGKTG
jgi:hypothetical protein